MNKIDSSAPSQTGISFEPSRFPRERFAPHVLSFLPLEDLLLCGAAAKSFKLSARDIFDGRKALAQAFSFAQELEKRLETIPDHQGGEQGIARLKALQEKIRTGTVENGSLFRLNPIFSSLSEARKEVAESLIPINPLFLDPFRKEMIERGPDFLKNVFRLADSYRKLADAEPICPDKELYRSLYPFVIEHSLSIQRDEELFSLLEAARGVFEEPASYEKRALFFRSIDSISSPEIQSSFLKGAVDAFVLHFGPLPSYFERTRLFPYSTREKEDPMGEYIQARIQTILDQEQSHFESERKRNPKYGENLQGQILSFMSSPDRSQFAKGIRILLKIPKTNYFFDASSNVCRQFFHDLPPDKIGEAVLKIGSISDRYGRELILREWASFLFSDLEKAVFPDQISESFVVLGFKIREIAENIKNEKDRDYFLFRLGKEMMISKYIDAPSFLAPFLSDVSCQIGSGMVGFPGRQSSFIQDALPSLGADKREDSEKSRSRSIASDLVNRWGIFESISKTPFILDEFRRKEILSSMADSWCENYRKAEDELESEAPAGNRDSSRFGTTFPQERIQMMMEEIRAAIANMQNPKDQDFLLDCLSNNLNSYPKISYYNRFAQYLSCFAKPLSGRISAHPNQQYFLSASVFQLARDQNFELANSLILKIDPEYRRAVQEFVSGQIRLAMLNKQ